MNFDLKIDASDALELVQRQLPAAMPYVKAAFLTGLAKNVQGRLTAQIPVAFDRPTPFTQRSAWVKAATKSAPLAEVYFPESDDGAGRNKREYIRPGAQAQRPGGRKNRIPAQRDGPAAQRLGDCAGQLLRPPARWLRQHAR